MYQAFGRTEESRLQIWKRQKYDQCRKSSWKSERYGCKSSQTIRSPCLKDIEPGAVVTLAEMEGPGQINHIWITVDNKTTEADCFVLRDLVIRMYWDDEETPSVESPLGDFFCCGFGRECFVNSVPVAICSKQGL